ncbi:MAG TPA: bifunctional folylpolyglutamate synthase/dihydrofolate synthase, partial [Ruminococcaceae bacterium]|nr:bifunctional folylpolyglutamate synthase/dihydrofolate synthase [Oscillospiraceae bacterium]
HREFAQAAEDVLPLILEMESRGEELSEFEAITAIAFYWFAQQNCDVVVLEVGLGGRLDATNVIRNPLCSVITHISYDHTEILGNTLTEIAGEKCGILKEGCEAV